MSSESFRKELELIEYSMINIGIALITFTVTVTTSMYLLPFIFEVSSGVINTNYDLIVGVDVAGSCSFWWWQELFTRTALIMIAGCTAWAMRSRMISMTCRTTGSRTVAVMMVMEWVVVWS